MSHKPEKLSQKMKNSKNKLPDIRKNRVQKLFKKRTAADIRLKNLHFSEKHLIIFIYSKISKACKFAAKERITLMTCML